MNPILQDYPLLISIAALLVFMIVSAVTVRKNAGLKGEISDLNIEVYDHTREAERLRIIITKQKEELEDSDRKLKDVICELAETKWRLGLSREEANRDRHCTHRLAKLEFILKKVHPQIYDDKRLDAWIDRLKKKRRTGK